MNDERKPISFRKSYFWMGLILVGPLALFLVLFVARFSTEIAGLLGSIILMGIVIGLVVGAVAWLLYVGWQRYLEQKMSTNDGTGGLREYFIGMVPKLIVTGLFVFAAVYYKVIFAFVVSIWSVVASWVEKGASTIFGFLVVILLWSIARRVDYLAHDMEGLQRAVNGIAWQLKYSGLSAAEPTEEVHGAVDTGGESDTQN
jgi:hypothetical protein